MRKTGSEVENDVYAILKSSAIKTLITGDIYKDGTRPLDSKKEDVIVNFISGVDGQIQEGFVNVNVYVPDIDNGGGGYVRNVARCRVIEIALNTLAQSLTTSEYHFTLAAMIKTYKAEGISQHFVNAKLQFRLFTI